MTTYKFDFSFLPRTLVSNPNTVPNLLDALKRRRHLGFIAVSFR